MTSFGPVVLFTCWASSIDKSSVAIASASTVRSELSPKVAEIFSLELEDNKTGIGDIELRDWVQGVSSCFLTIACKVRLPSLNVVSLISQEAELNIKLSIAGLSVQSLEIKE